MPTNVNPVNRLVVLIIFCLFAFQPGSAQEASSSAQHIRARIDEYMKSAVEVERFSGSILVAREGRAIVSKGYGMANVEFDMPNTPNTVFRLASVTKQFTATAIMMLQERGKLNINDPMCKYLTDCPAAWQPITIRHLLTMTHGIPGVTALELGPLRGLPVPWDQWLEATGKKPLEYTPGEKFKYLNSGYTLLGFIIERVSGKSYGEFLQENIFTPLGMKQTGYEDPLRIIKNRATGYKQLPGDPITNLPYREIIRMYAGGGIYSTTEDLLLWDKALYTEKLLSKRSIDEMFTPFKDMYPGKSYAYGWWSSQKFGRQEIAHGGNATGFITYIARYPSDRVTVIVLSNNERGSSGKISSVLSAIVFGAPYEIPKERKAVTIGSSVSDKYVGEYKFQYPPTTFIVTSENGKLMAQRNAEPKAEMVPESETKFFLKTEDIQFTFVKDTSGVVTGLIVHQGDGTLYEVMTGQKTR
ncbi:MAG TPA: serine hydrolase [Pyrinomonadaceae bacterium]|nr:serine hydrolase [Pyrinomonadaceae bacterium]